MDWAELLKLMTPQLANPQPVSGTEGPQLLEQPQLVGAPAEQWYTDWSQGATGRQFQRPPIYAIAHDSSGVNGKVSDAPNVPRRYNWLFDEQGIYKLRPDNMMAPHAANFNPQSIGIAHRGMEGAVLSPAALANRDRLIEYINKQYPGIQWKTHPELGPAGTQRGGKAANEGSWLRQTAAQQGQTRGIPMAGPGQLPDWLLPQQQAAGPVQMPVSATEESAQLARQPREPTIQVPSNPNAQGEGPTTWSEALSNPATAAFFIGMGTRLMTGATWNGGLSGALTVLGQGISEGTNAAYETTKEQDELFLKGAALDEKNEDRLSRERVARIGAESREGVATLRAQAAMNRVIAAAAAKGGITPAQAAAMYQKVVSREKANQMLSGLTDDQIVQMAEAEAKASIAFGGANATAGRGAIAGPGNSEIPAGQTSPGGSQGAPPSPPAGQNEAGDQQRNFFSRSLLGLLNGLDSFSSEAMGAGMPDQQGVAAPPALEGRAATGRGANPVKPSTTPAVPKAQEARGRGAQVKPWENFAADPRVQPFLHDKMFRDAIRKTYPEYKDELDLWEIKNARGETP